MIKVSVFQTKFTTRLRDFAQLAARTLSEVLQEEARLTAERILKLTPPKTAAQGKKRIAGDFGRVYLDGERWFNSVFSFRNAKVGERIQNLIRSRDEQALEDTFSKSPKLSRIHIEPFSESTIEKLRRNGKIGKGVAPYSFPLKEKSRVKAYQKRKQTLVGLAKSGWANCVAALGGSVPSWVNKSGTGKVVKELSKASEIKSITLINSVSYMKQIDKRTNAIRTALSGRKRDIETKIKRLLSGRK